MKRRRNPIVATRPLTKRDLGDFFSPPPSVMGGLRGYQPAGLVYDREPTSPHPRQALEGFGVLIVPEVVSYQAPHRVGYQVLNQNSGLPLHEGYFKKAERALDFADQVLIRYPCFFVQSFEEQRRDERYWDVNNRKHFPKILESDLYLAPPVEDVKGFRTAAAPGQIEGDLKKAAKYAEQVLKEKFGKDWRTKGRFEISYLPPLEFSHLETMKLPPYAGSWEAPLGLEFYGDPVVIRRAKGKKHELEFLTRKQIWDSKKDQWVTKYFKVPQKVVEDWYKYYPSLPEMIKTALRKMLAGRHKDFSARRKGGKFRPNPGKFYVYLNSGGAFGPLDSLKEAEAAAAFYLLQNKTERAAEIKQQRADGSHAPAAHIISTGPLGGVHYRIH